MILRQKLQMVLMILLTFLTFATYHQGTGGVMWLQYLSILSIMAFLLIFDLGFTNDMNFIFDPDADNWRRKVVRYRQRFVEEWGLMDMGLFGKYGSLSVLRLWEQRI